MDREVDSAIEFLGNVPLLQRLPSKSIRKIAELVQVKDYNPGEYVVREGETGMGLYFIWEGEAEVSGSVDAEEELHLKKFDYFGGTNGSAHEVNVVALCKLTCLVLEHGCRNLLQPKSIWNAEGTPEDFSLVEQILHLESLEVDLFRAFTLPDAPNFGPVFGGQLIGQALAAASKTVDCLKLVHSLHVSFIAGGDINSPLIYKVYHARNGKSFATRQVDIKQHGVVICNLVASFQKEEFGFEHQEVVMPQVPAPEALPSLEELWERRLTDPRLPISHRNYIAKKTFVPWPIEIRFCESSLPYPYPPRLNYWFKARGKLSDDPALHRCVVAYASDLIFAGVSLDPHRKKGQKTSTLSLDHSMWFHRPLRADDWLLYVIESPSAYGGRGFVCGRMFNQKGELIVSLTQEALIRKVPTPETLPSMEELWERRLTDPRLPISYRNYVAAKTSVPWPIEIRFCDSSLPYFPYPYPPRLNYWFKARGKLSDDPALHRCVVAYASDLVFADVSLNPHRKRGQKTSTLSLDHSMWFHRPVRADDWLLHVVESPSTYGGRGFIYGRMFNRKGELIVSLIQEALIRKVKPRNEVTKSNL